MALAGTRSTDLKEKFPEGSDKGQSRDKAGERMGVSRRSVSSAKDAFPRMPEIKKIRRKTDENYVLPATPWLHEQKIQQDC